MPPKAVACPFIFRSLVILSLLLSAPQLLCSRAYGNPLALTLAEKDLKKGESIILQLRRLEQATANPLDVRTYSALVGKMYPALFVKVSELKDSDLKTDLTTAVFLYERALRDSIGTPGHDCGEEMRSAYAKVCAENEGTTPLQLIWAKARLHTEWADSIIKYHRGATAPAVIGALEEMRRERQNDITLAQNAVAALKTLEKDVCAYSSLADFQEQGRVANVSFERLSTDMASVLRRVDSILQSLPRGPLFYPLYNARNAYANGLFWWQKTYGRQKLVVDAASFNSTGGATLLGLDPAEVNYTVVINWRNAIKRTRQAEALIDASKVSE